MKYQFTHQPTFHCNVCMEVARLQDLVYPQVKSDFPRYTISMQDFLHNEEKEFVEKGADIEHERWAGWQKYLHSLCIKNEDGTLTIPLERVQRWERQISTPYSELPEQEKESDRIEVRKYLPLLEERDKRVLAKVVEMVERQQTYMYNNDDLKRKEFELILIKKDDLLTSLQGEQTYMLDAINHSLACKHSNEYQPLGNFVVKRWDGAPYKCRCQEFRNMPLFGEIPLVKSNTENQ